MLRDGCTLPSSYDAVWRFQMVFAFFKIVRESEPHVRNEPFKSAPSPPSPPWVPKFLQGRKHRFTRLSQHPPVTPLVGGQRSEGHSRHATKERWCRGHLHINLNVYISDVPLEMGSLKSWFAGSVDQRAGVCDVISREGFPSKRGV